MKRTSYRLGDRNRGRPGLGETRIRDCRTSRYPDLGQRGEAADRLLAEDPETRPSTTTCRPRNASGRSQRSRKPHRHRRVARPGIVGGRLARKGLAITRQVRQPQPIVLAFGGKPDGTNQNNHGNELGKAIHKYIISHGLTRINTDKMSRFKYLIEIRNLYCIIRVLIRVNPWLMFSGLSGVR